MLPIRLRKVTKQFGPTTAVDHIDLVIEPGELFFLLGPSGCGKTTLLRMIAGLIDPTAGSIHFGDRDVTRLPTSARNAAMVFQGYALWPHMTVAQNVAFGLDVRRVAAAEKRQRVDEALRIVRMDDLADRRPAQLSGGQQQRVALARALVVNPDVLLLDEPLSNLDAKLRLEMRLEIRRICTEAKITSVYVTHDQEEALSMADRVAIMNRGHIAQLGSPQMIYAQPVSEFVAGFIGQTNILSGRVRSINNGLAEIEHAAGILRSRRFPEDLINNAVVKCSIRPEALRLIDGQTAENQLLGQLRQSVYLGHSSQFVVELHTGELLKVNQHHAQQLPPLQATVHLGFSATDVNILLQ